jgi:hypothetical protein
LIFRFALTSLSLALSMNSAIRGFSLPSTNLDRALPSDFVFVFQFSADPDRSANTVSPWRLWQQWMPDRIKRDARKF